MNRAADFTSTTGAEPGLVPRPTPRLAAALLDRARARKAEYLVNGRQHGLRLAADLQPLVARLVDVDPAALVIDPSVARAFWINVYNALVIESALRHDVKTRVDEVPNFFANTKAWVAGFSLSLDDIEHGILRGNRGHPRRWIWPQFLPWDPRRRLVVRPVDVRVHFALCCGAVSCPPVRSFDAAVLDRDLKLSAAGYLEAHVRVDNDGKLELPRLLLWYSRDFGFTTKSRLRVVESFLGAMSTTWSQAAKRGVRFAPYDWSFG